MITSALTVRRGLALLIALVLAVIVLLVGIWLGGHPGDLPSPLRGSFFEARGLVLVNQALNVLTTRYYRRLNRSGLVTGALSGMVASLDDPYSNYSRGRERIVARAWRNGSRLRSEKRGWLVGASRPRTCRKLRGRRNQTRS